MFLYKAVILLILVNLIYSKSTSLTIIVNPLSTECVYENIAGLLEIEMDYQVKSEIFILI